MKKYFLILCLMIFVAGPVSAAIDCLVGRADSNIACCGLYEDENKDRVCDNSQEDLQIASSFKEEETTNVLEIEKKSYRLLLLTIVILAIYVITFFLYKKQKIKLIVHRKIWNVVLLISFLLCGISGILLIIRIDYGIRFAFPPNLLFGHVETGIIFAVVCSIHVIERFRYFKNIFK